MKILILLHYIWTEGEGGRVEGNRVKLTGN